MNSDPHENAAWRAFGILDADEAANYDQALCENLELKKAHQEMEILVAAVAVVNVAPVTPKIGQLERLQSRLGLNLAKRTNWLGISGWAAASLITIIAVFPRDNSLPRVIGENEISIPKTPVIFSPTTRKSRENPMDDRKESTAAVISLDRKPDEKNNALVEAKRLAQEIKILQTKLKTLQNNDRERLELVPGLAWPIVMRMAPPGSFLTAPGAILKLNESPIVALLEDGAINAKGNSGSKTPENNSNPIPEISAPSIAGEPPITDENLQPSVVGTPPIIDDNLQPTDVGDPQIIQENVVPSDVGDPPMPIEKEVPAVVIDPQSGETNPVPTVIANPTPIVKLPKPTPAESEPPTPTNPPSPLESAPSAVPIYDPARNVGTLVVSNLPEAKQGIAYRFWVVTRTDSTPIYVGRLPNSGIPGAAESFDFSLGSPGIVPIGFIVTRDRQLTPAPPSRANSVLQGPQ